MRLIDKASYKKGQSILKALKHEYNSLAKQERVAIRDQRAGPTISRHEVLVV